MFEDSLIESGNRLKTNRLSTTILSVLLQVGLICILILIPLIYTDALPKTQLMTFLVAPHRRHRRHPRRLQPLSLIHI